jgi:hypothetical protein
MTANFDVHTTVEIWALGNDCIAWRLGRHWMREESQLVDKESLEILKIENEYKRIWLVLLLRTKYPLAT